jgi:hypothetical protein
VHYNVFNLQAGVPSRRPFSDNEYVTMLIVSPSLSRLVPVAAPAAVMSSAFRRCGEGPEGFDCFSILLQDPLCKVVGLGRFFSFFWITL